jgi:hypothetical protein
MNLAIKKHSHSYLKTAVRSRDQNYLLGYFQRGVELHCRSSTSKYYPFSAPFSWALILIRRRKRPILSDRDICTLSRGFPSP